MNEREQKLREALLDMVAAFGRPKREDYPGEHSFRTACAAVDKAREALKNV